MKRRLFYLTVGYLLINSSIDSFEVIINQAQDSILTSLFFHSFQWLAAILLFISGFLLFSRYVKITVEQVLFKRFSIGETIWIAFFLLTNAVLMVSSIVITALALSMALMYGILDAKIYNKSNRFLRGTER